MYYSCFTEDGIKCQFRVPIIFVHPTSNIIIGIYVDDLIVGHRKDAAGMAAFNEFKRSFGEKFNATHSGPLEWFLGIASM